MPRQLRHMAIRFLLIIGGLLGVCQGVMADSMARAMWDASTKTLTFYYGEKKSGGTSHWSYTQITNTTGTPGWYSITSNVTKVVFESSFANVHPTSCSMWFCGMSQLTTITGLSYLQTDKVTNMASMFFDCSSLTSLDVSSFNTGKVTNMGGMFQNCTGLTSLNLIAFNTAGVTSTAGMFKGCTNLKTICVNETKWSTAAVTSSTDMFDGCTSLVGGNGTTYSSSYKDKTYARVDKQNQKGYLTDKCTIVWKNYDGTVLETDYNVLRLTMPTYNGSTPTRAATAQYTYTFKAWSPTVAAVTKYQVYTATYTSKVRKYTITVKSADADQGSVSGGGTYSYGSSVTLTATAKGCYRFKKWSDGNTANPRIVTVTGEKTYTAQFEDNTKSGTYGPDNIEWSFDYCDSTLSITGNGELRCDNNTWGPNGGGINPNLVKRAFVGKGVTYLGIYTLSNMSNIEYIEVEDGHPTHRTGCNAIIRIGTEQEGDTLIFGCPHTVIPTTCTTIRGYAFWDDHLVTEMTIPSSVRQIANMQGSLWQGNNGQVFYTSNTAGEGLKDLYVEWTTLEDIPEVPNNRLGDMTKVRLHVPCGTTALYKQVTGWTNFKEYIEEATSYTVTVQTATGDTSMGSVSIIEN